MASRADVVSKLRTVQSGLIQYLRSIERGETSVAGKQARQLFDGIHDILHTVQGGFAADFAGNRLPRLEVDRRLVDGFDSKAPTRDELRRIAIDVRKQLRSLECIVRYVYPRPKIAWREMIGTHWKKAVAIVAVVAGVFAVLVTYRSVAASHEGLTGQYFADVDLKDLSKQRRDREINFGWGGSGPFRGWRKSEFSARWTGFVRVPADGKWEFQMYADDGVRLTIANKLVIDNWNMKNKAVNRARLRLEAGYYPIKIEYFQFKKRASVKLFWKSGSTRRVAIVPSTALVPSKEYLAQDIPVFEAIEDNAVIETTSVAPEGTPVAVAPTPDGKKSAEHQPKK